MATFQISGGSAQAYSDDGTITLGGTAQFICAGQRPSTGFSIFNNHPSADLWFSDSTVAAIDGTGCVRIPAMALYETPGLYVPIDKLSLIGVTTGHKYTARYW